MAAMPTTPQAICNDAVSRSSASGTASHAKENAKQGGRQGHQPDQHLSVVSNWRAIVAGNVNLHSVFACATRRPCSISGVEFVVDFDVEVSPILAIRFIGKVPLNRFALLDREDFSKIEDGLLPMRVFGVRTCRESDGFVARCEVNVKPSNESMDEVVPLDSELKWLRKGQLRRFDRVEINGENRAGVGDQRL